MNKEELIKATQILQKHIPNRYPLQNAYIDAMNEYAEWYHEEKSKLSQHDVIKSVCECGKYIDCQHNKCISCLAKEYRL